MSFHARHHGFSLLELVVATSLLAVLATVGLHTTSSDYWHLKIEQSALNYQLALDRARWSAEKSQQACALWVHGAESELPEPNSLQPCVASRMPLRQRLASSGVLIHANLPNRLRFTRNGLLLDGGIVVFSHPGSQQRSCVVVSLPLGVTRSGRYSTDPTLGVNSQNCLPFS